MKQHWIILPLLVIGILGISESFADETKTLFISPNLVDCVGVGPQKCMQVRDNAYSEWMNFHGKIGGFSFAQGTSYQISVKIIDVENPPADASSKKYELIKIIKQESTTKHFPYKNTCAPGFVPLGKICVLNDRCGPGAYPGKICEMDGMKQPYLRPLQQGNAGISANNVICAEDLRQMFNSNDGTPVCVKPQSIQTLKERGWQTFMPVLACTLEYAPICGVDGKTYGNSCMIESNHVAVKNKGECKEEIIPTQSDLAKEYEKIQESMSSISKDIYNGMYNGVQPLDEAITILENGKTSLTELQQQYNSIPQEQRTDRQIAMKFSTLGKMGFASIDSQINAIKKQIADTSAETSGIFADTLSYTLQAPAIDSEKGYAVTEIADGVYWLVGSGYQTMFVTTGQGVVVVDAPKPIGEKYLDAINEVTDEPITHMIYSHHHPDHTGSAGEIFPEDITYIAHKDAADLLASENDPARPIPNMILEGDFNTLEIGDKTIEFHNIGDFHSKGNWLILLPQYKIGMLVDLFRPAESPYRAFGVTPDIELYLETHDVLKTFDFDVLLTGHTNLLATKDHITTNKEFTQSIMDNAQDALDSGDSNPADTCAASSIVQWGGKLGNLDAFMADHCNAMIEYLQSK